MTTTEDTHTYAVDQRLDDPANAAVEQLVSNYEQFNDLYYVQREYEDQERMMASIRHRRKELLAAITNDPERCYGDMSAMAVITGTSKQNLETMLKRAGLYAPSPDPVKPRRKAA